MPGKSEPTQKLTIEVPADLHRQVKLHAAAQATTIRNLVIAGLRHGLNLAEGDTK